MEIIWSPLSLEDIEQIGDFIAEDSPTNAAEFIDQIIYTVERLEEFPMSGNIVEENPIFRQVIYKDYRVVYFLEIETINIITVLGPGRNL